MKDSLCYASWEDFRARYNHTYCWLLRGPERLFVYINDINPEYAKFSMGTDMTFTANADSGATFEFIPVDRGWYNTVNGELLHLSRIPERQFRRGISDGNTVMVDENLFSRELTYRGLHDIFSIPKQWDKPFDPGLPNALSKHFAYLPNRGALYFHNVPVAEFTKDGFQVDHLFLQEVTDTFRRRGINVAIKGR